ncbi:DUF2818 family protein [Paludibacterium yongneupense]|uniref:DUF2818 family protein n=1 Tax=Paludibacterium yongneupense TaxID=400061 RepID=UPI0003FA657A|nr:DUF2818 family protein [Paludibacterium yongneupense]
MQSSVYSLLLVALLAANLPFVSQRVGFVLQVERKAFGWRLLELLLLYGATGLLGRLLESRLMPVQHQSWTFYVVTFFMFLVFAFPGFVLRYFWKTRRG